MGQIKLRKLHALALTSTLVMSSFLPGCTEKNLYDPDYNQSLPSEAYPDFSTRTAIPLNIDYGAIGSKTLIELYTEYPFEQQANGDIIKSNCNPTFAAYTDENGHFSGKIRLTAFYKEVYLYTSAMGLPQCSKLDITSSGINFNLSEFYAKADEATTRGEAGSPNGTSPYAIDDNQKLYSLCQWGSYGKPLNKNYLTDAKIGADWIKSVQHTLWQGDTKPNWLDNSKYLVDENHTNITIATQMKNEDGSITNVIDAGVTLTFINESAWYQNTLGYYYYPSNSKPSDISQVKKYIILPNASTSGNVPFDGEDHGEYGNYKRENAPVQPGRRITLQYFNENGKASDRFPAGYTIGWFVITNAFKSGKVNTNNEYIYSNESFNPNGKKSCIALNDKQTGRIVVGFEDGGDTSYEDIIFFIESDPRGAILDPDKPSIDNEGDVEIPDKTMEQYGTLAFEDLWPNAGDYDMNDVVVEYQQKITFDKDNKVKKIVDIFKPVQRENSAAYTNAFAYQIDASQLGSWDSLPEGTIYESETHSFIVFPSAKKAKGQTFEIVRVFNSSNTFKQTELKDYNPYIIAKYILGAKNRTEVHLPKMPATIYENPSLAGTHDDAYYINKNGKFPFAICLTSILNFKLPEEGTSINEQTEYPLFDKWVESGCKEYTDWYIRK